MGNGMIATSDVVYWRGPPAEQQTAGSARDREHQALGYELTHDPPSPAAECQAHGDFLLTRRRAGKQHVGDVQAGNQQHRAG